MLSYFRFLLLPHKEKVQYVQEKGIFLLSQPHKNEVVDLYALSDFFIELHYDEQYSHVKEIIAFKGVERLQQYTQSVSLANLIAPA
jgi:hypothetical protein